MPRKNMNDPPIPAANLDRFLDHLTTEQMARLQAQYEMTIRPDSHVDRAFQTHGWRSNHVLRDFRMWVLCRMIDDAAGPDPA